MRRVTLTKGKYALVDDRDYARVSKCLWYAMETDAGTWYAVHKDTDCLLLMHRAILNVADTVEVDHIDGDGLNNQRYNIRPCTSSQNKANRGKVATWHGATPTSTYKGVCWYPNYSKWRATIVKDGKQRSLGYHDTPESAAMAYNEAARELFGDFARLNELPR